MEPRKVVITKNGGKNSSKTVSLSIFASRLRVILKFSFVYWNFLKLNLNFLQLFLSVCVV